MTHQDVGPEHGGRSPTPHVGAVPPMGHRPPGLNFSGLRHASDAQLVCALVSYASPCRFEPDPRYRLSQLVDPAAAFLKQRAGVRFPPGRLRLSDQKLIRMSDRLLSERKRVRISPGPLGRRQVAKAEDFDSSNRGFESHRPYNSHRQSVNGCTSVSNSERGGSIPPAGAAGDWCSGSASGSEPESGGSIPSSPTNISGH